MDYLNNLNDKQREAAVHTEGPLLILAGAGSGKTSTMTHRIAYLINEKGVSPYNILAVTFTNKAAAEMKERVEDLIGAVSGMWIMTFHSACLRILRKYPELLGYEKGFNVYDPTDQKVIVKSIIKDMELDEKKFTPNYCLNVISKCKEKAKSPDTYRHEQENNPLRQALSDIYERYQRTLMKNNAMDFDDLLLNAVKLFEQHADVLEDYRHKFRYVMVDEYQDTNYLQYKFVTLIAEKHENICVVGDDDQCIYQWRGADIKNILDFEKDFKDAKVVKLEQNYRSHANILDAANSVIKNNKGRKSKKLWTDRESGEKVQFYSAYDEKEEARYVASEIERLHGKGRSYRDFAILYRTNVQSRTFEASLSAYKIPYQVLGGLRYYDRKEIKDMMAYLRLVQNPRDDLSIMRVINEPKRGIGGKTVDKLNSYAATRGISLFELLKEDETIDMLPTKGQEPVRNMIRVIDDYNKEQENLKISDIYDSLMIKTGYLKALEDQNTVEAEGRIENLLDFKSVIYDYEHDDPQITLFEFMEKITLISDIDNHDKSEDAVTLMTLHSAKGLEFPVVFMPGMEEGLFPGTRAIENPGGMEEERRLCYVGMTRAKEKLYVTAAKARTVYGKFNRMMESRFLKEVDKNLLDGYKELGHDQRLIHGAYGANDGFSEPEAYRPFDHLKQIKETVVKQNVQAKSLDLKNGDRVKHSKFGEGMVLEANDKIVSVMFDSVGKKKLAVGMAPLEKI
jgi:DNA helicase-2/ATP-dependent DNA helicase PcrA